MKWVEVSNHHICLLWPGSRVVYHFADSHVPLSGLYLGVVFSLHLVHEYWELSEYERVPGMWKEHHFPLTSCEEVGKVLLGCGGNPEKLGTKSDVGRFRMESGQHLLLSLCLKSEPSEVSRVHLTCSCPLSPADEVTLRTLCTRLCSRSSKVSGAQVNQWRVGAGEEKESQHLNLKRKS